MNKKLLLGAALLVGMGASFTSCVDSTESASVTAVREAKAEQLKSIADLNKANAQAALILAQAEQAAQAANQAYQEAQAAQLAAEAEYLKAQATLMQAQAEVEKAKAAAMNAQTENEKKLLEAELQKKELERQLIQAELDKKAQDLADQKAAAESAQALLEKQLAQLEQTIKSQEIQNAINEQKLKDMVQAALDKAEDRADQKASEEAQAYATEYNRLVQAYNAAVDRLVICQRAVAVANANLLYVQANLISVKNSIQRSIQTDEANIEDYTTKRTKYQAIIDALSEYAGTTVTPDLVAEALTDKNKAEAAKDAAEKLRDEKELALYGTYNYNTGLYENGALPDMVNSQYVKNLLDFYRIANGDYVTEDGYKTIYTDFSIIYVSENETEAPSDCLNKYCLKVTERTYIAETGSLPTVITTYVPVSDYYTYYDLAYASEWTDVEGAEPQVSYKVYTSNYNLINDGAALNTWLGYKENQINYNLGLLDKDKAEANLAEAEAKLNGGTYTDAEGEEVTVKKEESAQAVFDAAYAAYEKAKEVVETAEETMPYSAVFYGWGYPVNSDDPEDASPQMQETALWQAWNEVKDDEEKAADALKALNDAVNATREAYAKLEGGTYIDAEGKPQSIRWQESAEYVKNQAFTALRTAIDDVEQAKKDLNAVINGIDAEPQIKELKEQIAEIIAATADNDKNIEAANIAEKDYAEARVAYNKANNEYTEASSWYETVKNNLYNQACNGSDNYIAGDDWQLNNMISRATTEVAYYDKLIKEANDRIKENKGKLDQIANGENPDNVWYESEVAEKEAYLEEAKQNLKIAEDRYDIAKSELESFVKNHE